MTVAAAGAQEPTGRRPYRSRLREQRAAATKRAIVSAAEELFAANGWAATGMREVAAAAGVATETVYSHFTSKGGLLRAVADAAVVGDDAPVALAERPEFAAMGKGSRAARVRAAAALTTAVNSRTAAIAMVLRQAASGDEEIAEMLSAARERQRDDVAAGMEMLMGRAPTSSERDGVWAIVSQEVYLLLVDETGWPPEQYEAWVAETLERVVPRS